MREVKPCDKPLFTRLDHAQLKKLSEYPIHLADFAKFLKEFLDKLNIMEKTGEFLAREHVLAVIVPSRDGRDGGSSGGTVFDDSGADSGGSSIGGDMPIRSRSP